MSYTKVFVYGTLRKNRPNHHVLNSNNGIANFVSLGRTRISFPFVIGGPYNTPFVLPLKNKGNRIFGEIYNVDDEMLAVLDDLEGYPNYYDRWLIEVTKVDSVDTDDSDDIQINKNDVEDIDECFIYVKKNNFDHLINLDYISSYPLENGYIPREKRGENWKEKVLINQSGNE
eukprot:TRINITY_DN7915_c0_g1_i1.p1 TRINITY_DN7915_c0_g1~~TRINITY_DN7915_c0_g1_i1.p1  ORF type:complete len:173 (+),score=42.38 TRINITY_DN7915_c0_g1_i1:244-762(+)